MKRYESPPASFFKGNRARLAAQLAPGHLAIFFSNPSFATNADNKPPFVQCSSLYYLTGLDQEDTVLVLFPDAPKADWKEMVFIRETNEHIARYEGWKYSKTEARVVSGIQNVKFTTDLETMLQLTLPFGQGMYLYTNEHELQGEVPYGPTQTFAEKLRRRFPGYALARSAPLIRAMRAVKQEDEVKQMQKACDITNSAFRRVLKSLRPGMMEFEIEAEVLYEFVRLRAAGPAYPSIVASGKNSLVLHYVDNDQPCRTGEMLLLDFGAR
ncbi:MAG: aminopeptidase P N-terminal domain-containing protein [Bacteroidota bacterium]